MEARTVAGLPAESESGMMPAEGASGSSLAYEFKREGARIVQCKMILKSISFPMLHDPEIGILPPCQVDADSDEKHGSAGAGAD
jgi:hypothetical protein